MVSKERGVSIPWLVVGLTVWFVSAVFHQKGVSLAGELFAWAKEPGTLTKEGGALGMAVLEGRMAMFFATIAVAMLIGVMVALRGVDRSRVGRELVPWLAWAVMLFLIWKMFIVYATELVHFGQYALVGVLIAYALDRGRLPVAAFLLTVGLGLADELFQHFVIANLLDPLHVTMSHWFDFSDIVLDALGAAGGVLPFLTWQRLKRPDGGVGLPDTSLAVKPILIVFALITLPLSFLDPADLAHHVGYYIDQPYWGEYDNNKPTHWPSPREGAPLVIAVVLILATLLEPKRRELSQGAIGVLLALAVFALHPPSRQEGMPVSRRVPYAGAVHTNGQPPVIDGRLDDPVWKRAARLGPFRRHMDGGPAAWNTYAYVAWDESAIYVAFQAEDPDVWARDVPRDKSTLPGDEVVELFLDDGGDGVTYYEVEVSPANRVYDLFCLIPAAPVDHNPWQDFLSFSRWSAPTMETAVHVNGELDLLPPKENARNDPKGVIGGDRGYSVEIKIPWVALQASGAAYPPIAHRPIPPAPGDRWRMGLMRNERVRGETALALDPKVVQKRLQISDELWPRYIMVGGPLALEPEYLPLTPAQKAQVPRPKQLENPNAGKIMLYKVRTIEESLSWSPAFNISYHKPQWFGRLEFLPKPAPAK
ncbi:MAG: hypothetical protein JKY65_01300 [Planctomycetes bacterium]|nr:hypothetical protein [Planctomycetota bacterium]